MNKTFTFFEKSQFILSKLQGIPVIGMLFSPIKIFCSCLQTLIGTFSFIHNKFEKRDITKSKVMIKNGFKNLFYSIINILSVTVIGFSIEYEKYFSEEEQEDYDNEEEEQKYLFKK